MYLSGVGGEFLFTWLQGSFRGKLDCLEKQGCRCLYLGTLTVQCEVSRMFANVRRCSLTEWFYMVFCE